MVNFEDFIEIIKIKSYEELIEKLQGKSPNFRENYIFRGLGSSKYELIPSALRKDENGNYMINNYIDSKFCVYELTSAADHFRRCKIPYETYKKLNEEGKTILLNKNSKEMKDNTPAQCWVKSENEIQYKRELYVLLKFLNWADKSGLKISTTPTIRRLIHETIEFKPPKNKWPNLDFFEIISLAQHYGLPTQAMDWSYDYKSSLYFATNNILHNNTDDCVLWAFNYKLFENSYIPGHPHPYKLQFYRPEYNSNKNLMGQKGLFTFIISENYNFDRRPLDQIIIEDVINNIDPKAKIKNYVKLYGLNDFIIPHNEKIFYKFIIPGDLKHYILNELYLEGYSEENLFPGYSGVVQSIKNRVRLEEYVNELNKPTKKNFIMLFYEKEINNILNKKKRMIFKKFFTEEHFGNCFIYSKNNREIVGYFKIDELIKNTPINMWNTFKRNSIMSKEDFFEYFEDIFQGYAIPIKDLNIFKYPIKLNLNLESEIQEITPEDQSLNFLLNF